MIVVDVALIGLAVAFALGIGRVIIGPSLADRAVATDLCLFTVIASVALMILRARAEHFADVALIATLLGFLATIALAALVGREEE